MTGNLFDIQRGSTVDGPGIRTTVFFKGCNLHCAWCHNPESQTVEKQLMVYSDRCVHCGTCLQVCPNHLKSCELCGKCVEYCLKEARTICGQELCADDVMEKILADKNFYEFSGGGATFSGGECLLQTDFLWNY